MVEIYATHIVDEMVVDEVVADEVEDEAVQPDVDVVDPVVHLNVVVVGPVPFSIADTEVTIPSIEPSLDTDGEF